MDHTTQSVVIRGTTMRGGYISDMEPTKLPVSSVQGRSFINEYAPIEPEELRVDVDGALTLGHVGPGAWGFLPDQGEIERVAAVGVTFSAA